MTPQHDQKEIERKISRLILGNSSVDPIFFFKDVNRKAAASAIYSEIVKPLIEENERLREQIKSLQQ